MTMIKQRDGVSRRRRGEVKRDAEGKALAPEAYDIFYHADHVGYTQRLDGGKFRAFPIDGSFPVEAYKNHTEAVDFLVDHFIAGGTAATPAPAEAQPKAAKAKSTKAKVAAAPVATQLTLVKDADITPDPLAGQDVSIELTTPTMTMAAPAVEACARCGSVEPHQHATPAPVAELPDDTPFTAIADEPMEVSPEFTATPDAATWDAGYPEGPRPVADPFASMPPARGPVTEAEEPGWMAGPGFAPETPPFATVPSGPPFLSPGPDDPFEDVGFSDPFAEA